MLLDTERYPTPPPVPYRYGYDMGVERERLAPQKDYCAA